MKEQIYCYVVKDDNGDILLFKNKPTVNYPRDKDSLACKSPS